MGTDRQGFSLLEAIVALAILGSASIAALGAVAADTRAAASIGPTLEAQALAESKLAQVRLLLPAELALLPDSLRRGRFEAPFQGYQWTAEAREPSDRPGLHDVTVSVHWPEGTYALATRVFRPSRAGGAR